MPIAAGKVRNWGGLSCSEIYVLVRNTPTA